MTFKNEFNAKNSKVHVCIIHKLINQTASNLVCGAEIFYRTLCIETEQGVVVRNSKVISAFNMQMIHYVNDFHN